MSYRISVFTYIPSPYQVELFNAISDKNTVSLSVFYLYSKLTRSFAKHPCVTDLWQKPAMRHNHIVLDNKKEVYKEAKKAVEKTDLTVFNYYRHAFASELIKHRFNNKKAWCFWGERPGFNKFGWFGARYRRWKLTGLYGNSDIPIWGIGKWAVDRYRGEFGNKRKYFNVPYFSDLSSFKPSRRPERSAQLNFLFSGSLIHRKGVDLLASAFGRLADEFGHVRLDIMGEGCLRRWLEKKLTKHGTKVRFLGFQPWRKLSEKYKASHVLCIPSRYDGWSVAVVEGLAAGLPVISTDRTGAALEFIENNKNGWVIPAGDENALYKAMKEAALLSPEERLKRSEDAIASVSGHSLEEGVDRFHKAIIGTLNK